MPPLKRKHLAVAYAPNCESRVSSTDAENLAANPEYAAEHKQMVARLGAFLEKDPRWIGYWHSFRIDHYFDLPRPTGDPQMFRPI